MNFLSKLLFKLLGLHPAERTSIVDWSINSRGSVHPGWIVLAAAIVSTLVVLTYALTARHVRPAKRFTLAGLRVLFLCLLFAILARPVLSLKTEGSVRRALLLLCDSSLSMDTHDPRGDSPDDLKRAAIARGVLDPAKGLAQNYDAGAGGDLRQVTRLDLLKSALKNDKLNLLQKLSNEYELRPYTFASDTRNGATLTDLMPAKERATTGAAGEGEDAADAATAKPVDGGPAPKKVSTEWVEKLGATGAITPLGDALRKVIGDNRGQPLAGIVLMTDGGSNSGSDPLIVAQTAGKSEEQALPIYAWGIGMSSPKDVIVANLFGPEVSFAKDEVAVTVRVRTQNMEGQSGKLKLYLGENLVDSKDVSYAADGEQVVAMKFTPQKPGDFDVRAVIDPREDEASKTNNEHKQHLRVVDGKIKVLLVEQSPRWEFKYLQAQLMRDRRVELKTLLLESDAGLSRGENSPYLQKFPEKKEDLFKFDLVIFGDVDPKVLTAGNLDNLSEFVTKFGGGFLMIAGRNNAPQKYANTVVEKMLPVVLDPTAAPIGGAVTSAAGQEGAADKPIRLELTEKGKRSRMLQLSDKEQESLSRWAQLPPIYWDARVARAKPAAEVLLADPDPAKSSRAGKMPVVALQQYGLGQVLYVGTDNTWRWRRNRGDEFYLTLWGQVIQRLSLPHLLGASKRTQLSMDKENYTVGERVVVFARLYNENYEPVNDEQVKAFYTSGALDETGRSEREVVMRKEPDQPGQFRAEFVAPAPGQYRFHVDKPGDPKTFLGFNVAQSTAEQGETAMNEDLLKKLAEATGGQFFREETLATLPDAIRLKAERVRSTQELELWSTPLYFILLIGVVTVEWVLRKTAQLK